LSADGVPGIGSPADDSSDELLRRTPNVNPNVNYTLCAPDGVTCYANTNPSGNTEWEQFKIDTVGPFDPTKMDHLVPAIPAGIWSVNLKGMDLSNLNAYRAQYDIIAPPQCPSADPCDLPPPPAPLLPYLVGDTIWLDTNGNGTQDAGEAGISGVKVNLVDVEGNVIGTTTTDAQGKYSFQVENGVYTVKVDASNFTSGGALSGYKPTVDYSSDNIGDNERTQSVSGLNVMTYDFGYLPPCNLSTAQTLTQGGWSNKAHADLRNELLTAGKFPVVIGNSQNSVTLTMPEAVEKFLPSSGTPRQLAGRLTDGQANNIKNTLAGQTMTATLNYLQWNGLAAATLTQGPYSGKSVLEVISLANQALGSGNVTSTVYSNLTNALDSVNRNLDDGKVNLGNLACPNR
jgi:hypothetical protein